MSADAYPNAESDIQIEVPLMKQEGDKLVLKLEGDGPLDGVGLGLELMRISFMTHHELTEEQAKQEVRDYLRLNETHDTSRSGELSLAGRLNLKMIASFAQDQQQKTGQVVPPYFDRPYFADEFGKPYDAQQRAQRQLMDKQALVAKSVGVK